MGAAVGAAGQVAGEMAADKVGFLRNWYGQPALLGLGAFLMIRRKPTLAYALAGAAGYATAFNYKLNQFQQGKRTTSPVPVFGSGPPAPQMLAAPKVGDYDNVGAEDFSNAVGF